MVKKIFLIIFVLALYSIANAQSVTYTCSMHPEIHATKPGNCSKCGMKLIKEKPKAATKSVINKPAETKMPKDATKPKPMDLGNQDSIQLQPTTYTCVMHPEIHDTKPGDCPKCGMTLVKEKSKSSTKVIVKKQDKMQLAQDTSKPATYTCTMHPEIHATKSGNCPKCGMKLIKEKSKTMLPQKRDEIDKPVMDTAKKSANMDNMKMPAHASDGADTHQKHNIDNMDMPKANIGMIKTIVNNTPPRIVRYDLFIADTTVTFGKKAKRAIAVNGQIPMPTLTFTEGDTAEIYVHNNLNEETSLHWHGLFLPNQYDGVPYLTQMPIKAHTTHLYKFPIIQHGTHWYHSHTELQEQIGMYGMFIMNKRKEWDIPTIPIVLSEWIDMNPNEVHRSLHAATDWFAVQKGSTQSYSEAIKQGHFKTKVANEWKRMNAMDLTDVYYDNILVNGKNQNEQQQFKAGDKVRLRIANGGASDYFWLSYAGGKITVVATDGNDVEPVEVDRLIIAVSETYDVVVTIPENKSYEFLATPEDRTRYTSLWLGSGEKVAATKLKRPKYFAGMKMMNAMMDMKGNMIEMEGMLMENQIMDMNIVMYPEITGDENPKNEKAKTSMQEHGNHNMQMPNNNSMQGMNMESETPDIVSLNYTMLKATEKTTLPDGPVKVLKFDLTGNMNRYVWTLDNKTVSESDKILIKKGENIRIILYNNSMMRHPMHLHGHDFRLLNGQGEYAPMKNIIDIMPMERDTIEFNANVFGDWFFHCHILYHMMSGMGKVFTYENQPANPEIPNPKLAQRKLFADDREFHLMGRVGLESNGSDGEAMLGSTRWRASTLWHLGYHDKHGYESETMVGRFLGRMQWWYPYVGYDYHFKVEGGPENIFGNESKNWFGQTSNKNNRSTAVAGIVYTLPMLFAADARVDGDGKFRFQLGREDVPVTKRLRFSMMINTDKEYMAGLRYIATKYISISTHYDSDMGLGAGITFVY